MPEVAGVHHDRAFPEPEFTPVRGVAVEWPDRRRIDEVGDDADQRVMRRAAELGRHIRCKVIGQDGHGIGPPVAESLQGPEQTDQAGRGDRPDLDGDVGEHVLDVEHQRAPVAPGGNPPGSAQGQGR